MAKQAHPNIAEIDAKSIHVGRSAEHLHRGIKQLALSATPVWLKTTIERYAEGFAVRTSLVVEVSISPAVDSLSREKQRSLMRIVQEALTNVYRHAKATRVDITIEARERAFQLEIRDDGQGMMAGDRLCRCRPPALGTGLRIMQDRLDEMGGRLQILSAPTAARRGTTLRATFPYAFAIEQNGRRCAIKKSC